MGERSSPEVAEDAARAPEAGAPEPGPPTESEWATRYKYLLADFENFRKRSARDLAGADARARGQLLRDLLPVFEAVEHARASTAPTAASDPVRQGLDLILREFASFFDREGVVPVAHVGAPFDASVEEAVGEVSAEALRSEGTIVEIVQQGYRSAHGLVRLAKVIVARAATSGPPPEAPASLDSDDPPSPGAT